MIYAIQAGEKRSLKVHSLYGKRMPTCAWGDFALLSDALSQVTCRQCHKRADMWLTRMRELEAYEPPPSWLQAFKEFAAR